MPDTRPKIGSLTESTLSHKIATPISKTFTHSSNIQVNLFLFYATTKPTNIPPGFIFNTIQCNAMQYNTMQYNTIQYNTIQYNTIQYNTIQCNTMQCNAMQYNTIQCNAMQYNTMQCNTIQYNTLLILPIVVFQRQFTIHK